MQVSKGNTEDDTLHAAPTNGATARTWHPSPPAPTEPLTAVTGW